MTLRTRTSNDIPDDAQAGLPYATASISRRQFGRLLAAAVIGLPLMGVTRVHASDNATNDTFEERLSVYPKLNMTSTDAELLLPAEIAAGRYLVTIENQSTQGESAPIFVSLKDGQTADELLSEPGDPAAGLPAWFLTGTIVGAPIAPLGMTAQAIIDFPAGSYAVSGEPYQPTGTLRVTAGHRKSRAGADVDETILMADDGWTGMPKTVTAGKHLWKVTSSGSIPHRFQLYSYPEPVTIDALVAVLSLEEGAAPPPGSPDVTLAVPLGGLSPMSPGQTGWPVIDLEPGFYIGLCTIQNGEAAVPHYLSNELTVFSVEDPAG